MSLQQMARDAIDWAASNVATTVSLKVGNQTVTAIRTSDTRTGSADEFGEHGFEAGTLYVGSDDLSSQPALGATVTIDGKAAFVTLVLHDPSEGFYRIDYQDQRPVEGL